MRHLHFANEIYECLSNGKDIETLSVNERDTEREKESAMYYALTCFNIPTSNSSTLC